MVGAGAQYAERRDQQEKGDKQVRELVPAFEKTQEAMRGIGLFRL